MEWSEPRMIDGHMCRQCSKCRRWFGIGWYQYHGAPTCRGADVGDAGAHGGKQER